MRPKSSQSTVPAISQTDERRGNALLPITTGSFRSDHYGVVVGQYSATSSAITGSTEPPNRLTASRLRSPAPSGDGCRGGIRRAGVPSNPSHIGSVPATAIQAERPPGTRGMHLTQVSALRRGDLAALLPAHPEQAARTEDLQHPGPGRVHPLHPQRSPARLDEIFQQHGQQVL